MKKLFIHIGFPKTGTTSIQNFFYFNKHIFAKAGIYYPTPLCGIDLASSRHHGHLSMCETDAPGRFDCITWSSYREMYFDDMLKYSLENNILSAEGFVYDRPSNFSIFKKYYDIRIVCYFRNIFDYCDSVEKQFIKAGLRSELFLFSQNKKPHLLGRINEYVHAFGLSNCFFRSFDKVKKDGNLLLDFLSVLNVSQYFSQYIIKKENVTPPDVVTKFLFQLSFLPFISKDWTILRDEILSLDLAQWNSFRASFLPADFFHFDDESKQLIRCQGELLQDPDWYDYTMTRGEELAAIENHDLPPEIQHDIWEKLSDEARSIILRYWPKAGQAKHNEPLLPALEKIAPDVFEQMTVLRHGYTVSIGNRLRLQGQLAASEAARTELEEAARREQQSSAHRRAIAVRHSEPDTLFSRLRACLAPLVSTSARQAYDIRRSGLFDTGWYLERYSDVAEAGIDPVVHYVRFGAKEGRDPAPWFSTSAYLQANPDVAASGVNPFYHYIRHGVAEGRGSHEAHC